MGSPTLSTPHASALLLVESFVQTAAPPFTQAPTASGVVGAHSPDGAFPAGRRQARGAPWLEGAPLPQMCHPSIGTWCVPWARAFQALCPEHSRCLGGGAW